MKLRFYAISEENSMKLKLGTISMATKGCILPRAVLPTGGASVECARTSGKERCLIRQGSNKLVLRRNLTRSKAEEVAAGMRARSARKATSGCKRTGQCPTLPDTVCRPRRK